MPALYPRYNTLPVDDTDTRFQYGGTWSEVQGSSRQWDSGVMVTQQTGATVSFSFVGSDAFLYDTIPNGSGNVVVDISIDGGSPVRVTRACGAQPVYDDIFYKTPIMTDAIKHTVVVTNRGSPNIPFMFDKVDLHAQDFATMLAPAQTPTPTPAPPVRTPTAAPSSSSATGSSPLSSTPSVATQSDQVSASTQHTPTSASGTSLVYNLASTPGSLTVSSTPSSGLTAAPAQSSTVIVTTDARGATVTQTKAIGEISVSEVPGAIQTGTDTNGNAGAAEKMPTPIAVILAIIFGIVAVLLVLFFITMCMRRRRTAREKVQLANSPERNLMAPNPFRLESEPPFAGSDSEAEYAVGGAAIYRNEKRPHNYNLSNVTLDASIADQQVQAGSEYALLSRSGHSLGRESDAGLPAPTNGNFHHGNMSPIVERESTAFESAPPAYHDNSRTSIGTSFYQQSTR